jgi:hypothetical protein
MPSVDSDVASFSLPVPAGAVDADLPDPTIDGLLAYIGFWIKWGLDAKLATMTRPPVTDACPVASRYGVNPAALVARFNPPALFCWWDDKSKSGQASTIRLTRERALQVVYIFGLVKAADIQSDSMRIVLRGLISAVDAILFRAFDRKGHTGYAPPGFPLDTDIRVALDLNEVTYDGGQEIFLPEFVTASTRQLSGATAAAASKQGKGIQNIYPALRGTVRVQEDVGRDTALDPGDVTPELLATIKGNTEGGVDDAMEIMQRYLTRPDGTEEFPLP